MKHPLWTFWLEPHFNQKVGFSTVLIWIFLSSNFASGGLIEKSPRFGIKSAQELAGVSLAPHIRIANINDEPQNLAPSVNSLKLSRAELLPAPVLDAFLSAG